MSNSYKKICICGICSGSNHEWFKKEHRRERRFVKQILHSFVEEGDTRLPHPTKKYCNMWSSPSDGRTLHWGNFEIKKDHIEDWKKDMYIKLMRK